MNYGKEFEKFATKDQGINSNYYSKIIQSMYPTNLTPNIIEERQMNIAIFDVFFLNWFLFSCIFQNMFNGFSFLTKAQLKKAFFFHCRSCRPQNSVKVKITIFSQNAWHFKAVFLPISAGPGRAVRKNGWRFPKKYAEKPHQPRENGKNWLARTSRTQEKNITHGPISISCCVLRLKTKIIFFSHKTPTVEI